MRTKVRHFFMRCKVTNFFNILQEKSAKKDKTVCANDNFGKYTTKKWARHHCQAHKPKKSTLELKKVFNLTLIVMIKNHNSN